MLTNKEVPSQEKELVQCEDGSYTLYSYDFKESYHSSKDGALRESLEKHVKPALSLKSKQKTLTVLDICFGLGYNTFATIYYMKKHRIKRKIQILSPEFDEALVRSLNTFSYPLEFESIRYIIDAIAKDLYYEDDMFKIEVFLGDAREVIRDMSFSRDKIDLIYQDAFSPLKNPLLWTYEWFRDIRAICKDDALLTTYSTAASVRLGLDENGFLLYAYQGEGVRASMLASLKLLEGMEPIDMGLKRLRNPVAKSLHDEAY